jgi:molybdopterin/thiamine biosynthesis adenylyltransferase
MNYNYNRQLKLLDPKKIGNKSISLVGVGATGSNIALMLAQLGWGDIQNGQGVLKLFDGDIVEEHNLASQAFYPEHIGKPKVLAMNDIIKHKCNFSVQTFNRMIDTEDKDVQSTYVFILTDTMKSRKGIFNNCLKYSFDTDMIVETRMGLSAGRIYAFNPHISEEVNAWEKTLCTDEEAEVSACGASQSIVNTAQFIASIACAKMIQHFSQKYCDKSEVKIWNEIIFTLYPESFYMRMFRSNETSLKI